MKTLTPLIFSLTVMLGAGSFSAYAVDEAQAISNHQALAASYEQKADAQEELIAEHTAMKKEYKERFFVNEKVTPLEKVRAMETHCDAIIGAAEKEKAAFLESAKWHRMRAAELQGL